MRRTPKLLFATWLIVVFLLCLIISPTRPVFAATYTVTKTADTNDGVCDADCSLREAIAAANAAPTADTIILPAGIYQLTLTDGVTDDDARDLDIRTPLILSGASAATTIIAGLAGPDGDRVFEIHAESTTISGVTIRGGRSDGDGGAISVLPAASLVLRDSQLHDNQAVAFGGAIAAGGNNDIPGGDLLLERVTIYNNRANFGGGISAYNAGSIALTNVTLSGNDATNNGGGIAVSNSTVVVNNSTIVDNIADSNAINGGVGGGVFSGDFLPPPVQQSSFTLGNPLIARNRDLSPAPEPQHPDCSGFFLSGRYNLIQNLSGCLRQGVIAGDVTGADPRLAPFADYGGGLLSYALLADSPALAAGNPGPAGGGLACAALDTRRVARPIDGNGDGSAVCDIGAFEAIATDAAILFGVSPIVRAGGPLSYQVSLSNLGPGDIPLTSVTIVFAAGTLFQNSSGNGWSCTLNATTLTCFGGSLTTGAAPSLLSITAVAPIGSAPFSATASIGPTIIDNQVANNSVTVTSIPALPLYTPILTR
ncbi:MAG TPA: choice-of-anchor Q domain-containing protein [Roseiflexaceae bacterium]|nr:choice-of-anchor Q domain-containing protein [Roseiflexaceae bacterium]